MQLFEYDNIKGFTLIELIVGIGIFVSLIGMAGGAYMLLIREQSNELQKQVVIQDIQNFFEILDREIRTGYGNTFNDTDFPLVEPQTLTLVNQDRRCVLYEKDDEFMITRSIFLDAPEADSPICEGGVGPPTSITSKRTKVVQLRFNPIEKSDVGTREWGNGESRDVLVGRQGRVTVFVEACPNIVEVEPGDSRCVKAQTTITSRQRVPFNP